MFNLFKKTKPIIAVKLGEYTKEKIQDIERRTGYTVIETHDPNTIKLVSPGSEEIGDGNAVFIPYGTHEDFEEEQKKESGLWDFFNIKL